MKRDVELLYELGALRLMKRQWVRFHMPNVANNAEHMFRVCWIALVLAERVGKQVNTEKIVKMALMHDIDESRMGDVDYLSRQYVDRHEDEAMHDILDDTSIKAEFSELWKEYAERKSLESQIVKDADTLDVDLELQEQASAGHTLPGNWASQRDHIGQNRLFTQAAKELQKEIRSADPQSWHIKSPKNRLNGGDWKVSKST